MAAAPQLTEAETAELEEPERYAPTWAELAECTCPDPCDRDHEFD
jgi:hypothetical protein